MIRIVSMVPAATEIVAALGLTDRLVGISHDCDYPAEAARLPQVTHCAIHGKGLSSEEIDRWVVETLRAGEPLYPIDEPLLRELAPDLILSQALCDVCAPAHGSVAALAATLPKKPRVLNLEPATLADVFGNIRDVAAAAGEAERGESLCRDLESRVRAVQEKTSGLPRPTVFVMEWTEPIFNAGHWTPELIRMAGGTPVLSPDGARSVRIDWDELRAADPEVLVIACCGHTVERTLQDMPKLESRPGWNELQAVRNGRVRIVDGAAYFSRPGPRLVDTLENLAAMLHPSVFHKQGSR